MLFLLIAKSLPKETFEEKQKVKTMKIVLALSFVLCVLLCAEPVTAIIYFRAKEKEEQCFAYEGTRFSHETSVRVDAHYMLYLQPSQKIPDGAALVFTVRGPSNNQISNPRLKLKSNHGSFNFNVLMSGLYTVCLQLEGMESVPMDLSFFSKNDPRSTGVVKDRYGVQAIEAAPGIEDYSSFMEGLRSNVYAVLQETEYLATRQDEFDGTVGSTYTRVILFTVINAVVLVGACGWQILTLKKFFKAKKVV